MLVCRYAEGVHGQRKVGNPCSRVKNKRLLKYVRYERCQVQNYLSKSTFLNIDIVAVVCNVS